MDVNFKIDPENTQRIIMMGAIDNLVKGAAGQAVQNMNLMFGFNEAEGLITGSDVCRNREYNTEVLQYIESYRKL